MVTHVAKTFLAGHAVAPVEAFTAESFDGKLQIESFLTKPLGLNPDRHLVSADRDDSWRATRPSREPAFNSQGGGLRGARVRDAHGELPRGQRATARQLADAIFRDQDGTEAQDVLASLDAACEHIRGSIGPRLGIEGVSYGGQLSDWLVTQTDGFRAAIPTAGISNLVSFNYMADHHDYLAAEFGEYPHTTSDG